MNLITETWRGLVRRKLWPVALLLVAALVAVPFTLAKEPEVEPVPANAVANADEGLPATYVTAAGDAEAEGGTDSTDKRRRTLGDVKDPFEPAPLPKAKKKKKSTKKKATSTAKDSESSPKDDSTSSGSGSTGGGTTAPTAPVATPTPTATPNPNPANSIRVRFTKVAADGGTTTEVPVATVRRLEVLPDEEHPVLAFRGLENGGKVASFELTGTVTVEGDGECEPTPEECTYLKLRAGETAFVTVADSGSEDTDGQYQLDLVKINAKSKASTASKKLKKADEGALRTFQVLR
ncbi:hypothetical protein OJ997_14035 [Solirubrobacter phytolaccae]|uniref:Uncharacterized protein n=1 Tax=Solirubrobacter phytolaccae TaxID=1404360 RepID=A0A9X3N7Q0_9ACTN|nr:hypothetical protein [Solirubrobacter phytolaccae]MDA0181420.1 hypothetical protein [Solirubrobacter phytolaccae]